MAPAIPFLVAAAPYLAAAGAVIGAVGAINAADAKATADQNAANAAATNAQISRNNANTASNAAGANEQIALAQSRQRIGEMIAAGGTSGVDTSSGSPASSIGQSVQNGTLNALMIQYNGSLQRTSYLNAAQGDDTAAAVDTSLISQDQTAGTIGAASSLVGGASTYANNAAKLNMPTVM